MRSNSLPHGRAGGAAARVLRSASLALALLSAAGCSGGAGSDGGGGGDGARVLTSVTVEPESASVAKGLTRPLTATARYSDGSSQDVTAAAEWSSGDEAIVTVSNGDGTQALARALAEGTAIVRAAWGGRSGQGSLTVTAAVVVSVSVSPANAIIAKGTTRQYDATAVYSDTTRADVTALAEWSSSGAAATIAPGGTAAGAEKGAVTISATLSGVTGATPLTVTDATLSYLEVTPAGSTLPQGLQQAFTASGVFTDGRKQDLTGQVTWSSSDPSAATISDEGAAKGLASAVAPGTTAITATLGEVVGSTGLTVVGVTLEGIDVSPATASIAAGTALPFTALGTFSDGSTVDLTALVTWTSADPGVATVSGAGVVLAVAAGTVAVSASLGDVVSVPPAALTVTSAVLQSISIGAEGAAPGAPLEVPDGLSVQLTATGAFSDLSTQDLTALVSWSSSDPAVAAVSNAPGSEGMATSISPGTVTVTAGLLGVVGTAQLTVPDAALLSLLVTPPDRSLPEGFSLQFTATASYSNGSSYDVTALATWTSSAPSSATISNAAGTQGLASGLAVGEVTIAAILGHASGSTSLLVTDESLESITIDPSSFSVPVGGTQQLAATGHFSEGTALDLTRQVQWGSSFKRGASVSKTGLVTGRSEGPATITARKGNKQGSASATVVP